MPHASLSLPAELQAVGQARRFLRTTLEKWGAQQYDFGAPLVLTELATNAALHARTPFEVRLRLEANHLMVEVADGNPRRPRRRGYDADATTGRGMTLVESLCADWGVTLADDDGKVVWAQVPPDGPMELAIEPELGPGWDHAPTPSALPPAGRSTGGARAHQASYASSVRAAA